MKKVSPKRSQDFSKASLQKLSKAYSDIKNEISKIIVGQEDIIDHIILTMLSQGHGLLIGVPGLAKTLMIKTISEIFDLAFKRIQFTPDMMPSDITGTEILEDSKSGKKFRFIKGPIFANIILADEINRTPPKTQAALLQAMQEYEITSSGKTYSLDKPFFVLATQNPIEQEGTYPLPEAQLDRFMFSIYLDYPSLNDEIDILKQTTSVRKTKLKKVLAARDILELQAMVPLFPVSDHVIKYTASLVRSTRPVDDTSPKFIKDWLNWGAGPRAGQSLLLGAKSRALLLGKSAVDRDDIDAISIPVLRHRIVTNFNAESDGITPRVIIEKLIEFNRKRKN